MKVLFRTDASLEIGTGHVIRCLTLADALRERGAECRFICREHEGHLISLIGERGYKVGALPRPDDYEVDFETHLGPQKWLGVDWRTDLAQTKQCLGDDNVDWLIVDNYGLDHRWESEMRVVCDRIMVIDDLADRRHECNLLLDQNYGSSVELYAGLLLADCKQLHGPEFALLKSVYAERRIKLRAHTGNIKRVLIYFGGGSDPMDLTGMALRAFKSRELEKIELDIVVGSGYLHIDELEVEARGRSKTKIYSNLPDLSDLMIKADLAIGAGGSTTWERCCLGLPSIIIGTADNQSTACKALASEGTIKFLGYVGAVTFETLKKEIICLLNLPEQLILFSEKSRRMVDGLGTNRVTDCLFKLGAEEVS